MIEKNKRPYELLVRWGASGLVGAHVQFVEELVEDGTVLAATVGEALPVALGGADGFPVADLLSAAQAGAIATMDAALAEAAALRTELLVAQSGIAAAEHSATQLRGLLSKAQADLRELRELRDATPEIAGSN